MWEGQSWSPAGLAGAVTEPASWPAFRKKETLSRPAWVVQAEAMQLSLGFW